MRHPLQAVSATRVMGIVQLGGDHGAWRRAVLHCCLILREATGPSHGRGREVEARSRASGESGP